MNPGDKLRYRDDITDAYDLSVENVYPDCLTYRDSYGDRGAMTIDQAVDYRVVEEPLPGPFTRYMTKDGMKLLQESGTPFVYSNTCSMNYEVEIIVKRKL